MTPEDRQALKIETTILKGSDSPYIIKMYGIYHEPKEQMFYIVTEYVSGGELFERIIQKEYYNENDARKLTYTIAQALKYCHDRGVVHRDLKPENILLLSMEDDNSIKVADFGFAKQYDTSTDDALVTSCGTPGYVAPEILNGKKYGTEVDMWSFGVIIYILLSGYPPFHHENQKQLFALIRNAKFQFEDEYWSPISAEAKDLISKLLVVDIKNRLTIDQLLDHPWVLPAVEGATPPAEDAPNLTKTAEGLRKFQNRKKVKAAINLVMAQNFMKKSIGGGSGSVAKSDGAEATPSDEATAETPKTTEAAAEPPAAPAQIEKS